VLKVKCRKVGVGGGLTMDATLNGGGSLASIPTQQYLLNPFVGKPFGATLGIITFEKTVVKRGLKSHVS
jgi:hypothetical protein